MNHIRINEIQIENFKKIKKYSLKFAPNSNTLMGTNGAGKSTIFDAFTWCLFGKDSNDRKEFNFKPQDSEGATIPHLETTVLVWLKSGKDLNYFSRTSREKWVRKRGQEEAEFGGNDTLYSVNGVPCNAGEFALKVGSVINGELFKLLSSPKYFHGLKWQEQRAILTGLVGEILPFEVMDGFTAATTKKISSWLKKESIGQKMSELKYKIKELEKELASMPGRINEVRRALPDVPIKLADLLNELEDLEDELKEIDLQISGSAEKELMKKRELVSKKMSANKYKKDELVFKARKTYQNNKFEINRGLDLARRAVVNTESEIKLAKEVIDVNKRAVENWLFDLNRIETEWSEINKVKFDFKGVCPKCKNPYNESVLDQEREEAETKFNFQQLSAKAGLEQDSAKIKKSLNEAEILLADNERYLSENQILLTEIQGKIAKKMLELSGIGSEVGAVDEVMISKEYLSLKEEYEALQAEWDGLSDPVEYKELEKKRDEVREKISGKNVLLGQAKIDAKNEARIDELKEKEASLRKDLTKLEQDRFLIESYESRRIEIVSERINKLFQNVKFRLFEEQINGAVVECCETLIDGVPYYDANTASKLNAGLEIIAALNVAEGVTAPIFIDNRESVEKIIPMPGQVINLVFDPAYKELSQGYEK